MSGRGVPEDVGRELAGFDAGRRVLASRPDVVALSGGLTNHAWRVTAPGTDWVVRVGGARDGALAIDRRAELAALRAAAAAGLAPRPVHAAPGRGVLVLEYVHGQVWTREQARHPEGLRRAGAALRELHALDVPGDLPPFRAASAVEHYLRAPVGDASPVGRGWLAARAGRALAAYEPAARVLCHHDLHHLNIVDAGRLVFVDWEYAGAGDPALDLAAYACYHDLDAAGRGQLLKAYHAAATAASPALLATDDLDAACAVFDCLQALWYDAADAWGSVREDRRAALVGRLREG